MKSQKGLYFIKDKKCMVYIEDNLPHGVGDPASLVPISETPIWCYTKQLSQQLVFESGAINVNDATRIFVFNYNENIKQNGYIKYKDDWYIITGAYTSDDYKGEIFAYTKDTYDPTRQSGDYW